MGEDGVRPRLVIPGYELIRLVGRGGMGVAYLAEQLSLDRRVLIKLLNRDPDLDPLGQVARFRREAELMAKVSHPNITTIFDYGVDDGRPFLVMEYVEGGDLRSHLRPGKPLEAGQIRHLLRPLVDALECLHQHGILHLDLKPENILMAGEDTPKVCDFGIAVPWGSTGALPTQQEHCVGTIGYVAPEQQYRLPVDERSDQYSLAAVCYELMTGQLPLGAFPLPSQENPGLHPSVDPVIQRALSEDRCDRFPTIRAFGEALDAALASPVRRRHRLAFVTAATVLAVAGLLAAHSSNRRGLAGSARGPAPPETRQPHLIASTTTPLPISTPPRDEAQEESPVAPDRPTADPPEIAKPARTPSRPERVEVKPLGLVLVLIPKGTFVMGSTDADPHARSDEKPAHRVRIDRSFYLGAYEVTVGQFRSFVEATGYVTRAERDGAGGAVYDRQQKVVVRKPELNWRNPGFRREQADDEPVVQVCWDDANAFCQWLTQREGILYRLPTEAEWEYACRAGSQSTWSFGDDPDALCDFAWHKYNAGSTTQPVGQKSPNAFGLYDMYGNVWEWCKDRYAAGYVTDDIIDPKGPSEGHGHVLRGGSWGSHAPLEIRSANRRSAPAGYRYYSCGFRVRRGLAPLTAVLRSP
jgi:formylglycine-generating enzyme required for sulfatase activity